MKANEAMIGGRQVMVQGARADGNYLHGSIGVRQDDGTYLYGRVMVFPDGHFMASYDVEASPKRMSLCDVADWIRRHRAEVEPFLRAAVRLPSPPRSKRYTVQVRVVEVDEQGESIAASYAVYMDRATTDEHAAWELADDLVGECEERWEWAIDSDTSSYRSAEIEEMVA